MATIRWKKVNWIYFNNLVTNNYNEFINNNKIPSNRTGLINYYSKAIIYSYNKASKSLPKGNGRLNPIYWCTTELENLLEERTLAWE